MSGCCGNIQFKECSVHADIRYTGEYCPACERDKEIEELQQYIISLQGQIASLEMSRATAAAE